MPSIKAKTRFKSSFIGIVAALCTMPIASSSLTQERIDVALVTDGTPDRLEDRNGAYINELLALTRGEFDVRIHDFEGNWSIDSINLWSGSIMCVPMAITTMFGLAFATALTLLVVPVLYSLFFRVSISRP